MQPSSIKDAIERAVVQNWKYLLMSIASVVVFVAGWWLYTAFLHGDWPFEGREAVQTAGYVPYPWVVLQAFRDSFSTPDPFTGLYMGDHIFASLRRIFLGFVLAFALAVPAGLLMGRVRSAQAIASPIFELFRPIPPLAWVPVFFLIFRYVWGPVLIVFLGIFFPLVLNVRLGAKSVDPVLVDAARTLGARKDQVFFKVVLPYTVPYLMTGVKVGLGIGWMCIVAAEMLGSVGGGVGYYIYATSGVARYDLTYAGMVTIGLLSFLTTGVAGIFEQRLYKWMGMK